jgi:hypothetical protein
MNARLVEIPPEVAVYLPFDNEEVNSPGQKASGLGDMSLMLDYSVNCWHLTPLYGCLIANVISQARVGRDASCVRHLDEFMEVDEHGDPAKPLSSPSVAEYGEMQIGAFGSMEGSYKRVYSFIDSNDKWRLDTGFRIGSLITEWVSQVQTNPTLIGYMEGAPPIPAENYVREREKPSSSVKFVNSKMVSYMYGLRTEKGSDLNLNWSAGGGAEWKVNAGLGVETQVSAGKIKLMHKGNLDFTGAQFNNNVSTAKSHTNVDLRMELTSTWIEKKADDNLPAGIDGIHRPANTGIALIESEVADVFALRLKMRTGTAAPLVAYQMRPNPDIPKDRNLIAFPIEPKYTKQGCLNGYCGVEPDLTYRSSSDAPKDASYYKPVEAYALKARIRRAEEQLEGEFERYQVADRRKAKDLPSRSKRNICNSYVWTAAGGTFQEVHSTMDFVQQEVGGSNSFRLGIGRGIEGEYSSGVLLSGHFDAMSTTHSTVMQTKDMQSENGFELHMDLPPALDIRRPKGEHGTELENRVGAVDAYRWMSFWLEPSVEGTDAFFKQVVEFKWLESSPDPAAVLLRELRNKLKNESGNARTKAWRVFHRVTYVSRVLESIKPKLDTSKPDEKKTGALLADISCNWLLLQQLEPLVRSATTKQQLKVLAEPQITKFYPAIRSNPLYFSQVLELLNDYVGLNY